MSYANKIENEIDKLPNDLEKLVTLQYEAIARQNDAIACNDPKEAIQAAIRIATCALLIAKNLGET